MERSRLLVTDAAKPPLRQATGSLITTLGIMMKIRHLIILAIVLVGTFFANIGYKLYQTFQIHHEAAIPTHESIARLEKYLAVNFSPVSISLIGHDNQTWWDGTEYEEWTLSYKGDLPKQLRSIKIEKLPTWRKENYDIPPAIGAIRLNRDADILEATFRIEGKPDEIRISIWPDTNLAVARFIRLSVK